MANRDQDESHSPLVRAVFGIENGLLTVLFLSLVILGLAQILLRNLAGMPLPWADGAMRALVLWLTMVGAVVGAGRLRHIRIDLVENWLSPVPRVWLRRFAFLSTSIICVGLTWYSLHVVSLEYEFNQTAFLDVPTWVVQAIVPVGFGIMAARFASWGLVPPSGIIGTSQDSDPAAGDDP